MVTSLDGEGRYYVLNAIANQLRYPNNHTHYFSCVLLYLFLQSKQAAIMEQITRVLVPPPPPPPPPPHTHILSQSHVHL
jgi:CCR4-NOT transcription complex subunit 1